MLFDSIRIRIILAKGRFSPAGVTAAFRRFKKTVKSCFHRAGRGVPLCTRYHAIPGQDNIRCNRKRWHAEKVF